MLIEKDRELLRTIIEVYVGDGVPVSSQRVREAGRFAMSTATIRNRMVVLEREGYITKAHISSGRIPTDEGYRAHVDELQTERSLAPGEAMAAMREGLRADSGDMGALMLHTSQVLGALSRSVALVYGAVVQESRVRAVKLFRLDGGRLLAVVHLVPDYERTVTLRLEREASPEGVSAAEGLINRLVTGQTLEEARSLLGELMRDNLTDEGIIVREVTLRREDIFSGPPAMEMCFEARGRMLEEPELSDPRTLQLLLRILHNRDYLTSILAGRSRDRTQVTIGAEHGDEALRPFSLVTAGYRMGAALGVLGVMGPTRMRYDLAISLVGSVSRELRAIGEEFFQ
ncbi:MAG TPA: heat-inducible transcriptional repressor HrcA [Candidatus Krumholzibacteria bacterium]|nr:heat-inducible transcriptional repressor HrcA [Candidatus Krumholzibacteria bacterium]